MLQRIRSTLCSLKLAIILASIATLLAMGGSLIMHFNPEVFGNLDATTLSGWSRSLGKEHPGLSSWFYATGILIILLAINTACCFIDWLTVIKARWRKTGEYLIHLGFVLVVIAYFWGSLAGSRSERNRVGEGEMIPVKGMPGYYLRLDKFEPLLNERGRPIDMINTVSLLEGDKVVKRGIVKTNTPLLHDGLVVTPASFGRLTIGFELLLPSLGKGYRLTTGDAIPFADGKRLVADAFFPDAVRRNGRVFNRSDNVGQPAYLLRLLDNDETVWSGWYFLGRPQPEALQGPGFNPVVRRPVYRTVSYLTINRDPGSGVALVGGIFISLGVLFALFSFYYKRSRGDRPEIE